MDNIVKNEKKNIYKHNITQYAGRWQPDIAKKNDFFFSNALGGIIALHPNTPTTNHCKKKTTKKKIFFYATTADFLFVDYLLCLKKGAGRQAGSKAHHKCLYGLFLKNFFFVYCK